MTYIRPRIRLKRSSVSGVVPTIPVSDDFTDGSFKQTDIVDGEVFLNTADKAIYFLTYTDTGTTSLTNYTDFMISSAITSLSGTTIGIGGADTQIQFNQSNILQGSSSLYYDYTNTALTFGIRTGATGLFSTCLGYGNISSGNLSFAEGSGNTSSGGRSHVEGSLNIASATDSHSEGRLTSAIGLRSHSEGNETIASGSSSHSEGYRTTSKGTYSHAEGLSTTANGEYSHSEGDITNAIGNTSHAEGRLTSAIGLRSHSEGDGTNAIGDYSHSEGYFTIASGISSHSEGYRTTSKGTYSHAEGYNTTANGERSHSEGYNTTAIGPHSHASGVKCISLRNSQYSHGSGIMSTIGDSQYNRLIYSVISTTTSLTYLKLQEENIDYFETETNHIYHCKLWGVGIVTSGANSGKCAYHGGWTNEGYSNSTPITSFVIKNIGGTVTSSSIGLYIDGCDIGFPALTSLNIDISGTNVKFGVYGAASHTIKWVFTLQWNETSW